MRADALGHVTRYSDSSFYDECCILCGATDGSGDDGLRFRCTKAATPAEAAEGEQGEAWPDFAEQHP